MKITKKQLKQIIKEEIEGALEEGYRGPSYRYSRRGMETHALKARQRKESEEMKEKGRADALAGRPKDESITHLAYSRAYDETASKKEDMQETDVEEGKFRDMFRGKKPSASPESDEAAQYMRKLKQTKRGKEAASVSVKQTGRDMSRNLAKVGGKSRFEEDTE